MRKETFEKACELNSKIEDMDNALSRIERNAKDHMGLPLNFTFTFDEDYEAVKQAVVDHLKKKRLKLQKEFDALK